MLENTDDSDARNGYDENGASAVTRHQSSTDGDTIRTPRKRRRTRAPRPPLEVTVQIDWLTGPQADDLAHRQWLVIKEVLQWINDHPLPEEEAQEQPGRAA
jgi:hypothetical protein